MSIPKDVKAGETLILTTTQDTGDLYGVIKGTTEVLITSEAMRKKIFASFIEKHDKGTREKWSSLQFDDSSWKTTQMPQLMEKLKSVDGFLWLRKSIKIPKSLANKKLSLNLGKIDDYDDTYWNGIRVGGIPYKTANAWRTERTYTIPAELVREGEVHIAIRIWDTGGAGGTVADSKNFCIKPIDFEAEPISLAGEWKYAVGGIIDSSVKIP